MKKQTTRDRIIEQSAELFNTYGYHGCSLSHIMEATQLKKGGIYNHFKNKDEIAVEAFNYNYNRVLKRFRNRLDQASTSLEKLNSVIDVFVSFIDDPMVKGGGCPIFNTAMDSTNTHPELKSKAKDGIKGLKKYVEIKLSEGIGAGEFNSDINVKEIATLIIATLEGAIIMARVNDDTECLEFASRYLKGYIREKVLLHVLSPLTSSETGGEINPASPPHDSANFYSDRERDIHNRKYLKQKRQGLRNNLTTAEATLWIYLKARQIEGRKFRRQHSVGNYILDFYCPEEKLAIELDGEDHYHSAGYENDLIRDKYLLEELGIHTLRFENVEVIKAIDSVLDEVRKAINSIQ